MKKFLLTIFILIECFWGFSQSDFITISEMTLSDYDQMKVISAEKVNENIYLSSRIVHNGYANYTTELLVIKNNKLENRFLLEPVEQIFFSEIKFLGKGIILVGETPSGDDEEMQDYICYFDLNKKLIWSLKLEKKYEGITKSFFSEEYFEILTDGLKGFYKYKISYKGKILEKKTISVRNYIWDVINLKNTNYLIFADSLSEEGELRKSRLTLLDKDLNIINSKAFKPIDSYLPFKLLEIDNGYVIVGNVESERTIPYLYFINKDLSIRKSLSYHYEPEHYQFKNNLKINDIYSISSNTFIATGSVGNMTDITNIIFTLNEDKLLKHKRYDSSGLWGNNCIVYLSPNLFAFFEDVVKNEYFETNIKLINIELK
jgi:hypothetical protein